MCDLHRRRQCPEFRVRITAIALFFRSTSGNVHLQDAPSPRHRRATFPVVLLPPPKLRRRHRRADNGYAKACPLLPDEPLQDRIPLYRVSGPSSLSACRDKSSPVRTSAQKPRLPLASAAHPL